MVLTRILVFAVILSRAARSSGLCKAGFACDDDASRAVAFPVGTACARQVSICETTACSVTCSGHRPLFWPPTLAGVAASAHCAGGAPGAVHLSTNVHRTFNESIPYHTKGCDRDRAPLLPNGLRKPNWLLTLTRLLRIDEPSSTNHKPAMSQVASAYVSTKNPTYGGRVLMNASAMIAEREALRMGIEHLTVLFPTEVSSFDFQVEIGQYSTNFMHSLCVSSVFTAM